MISTYEQHCLDLGCQLHGHSLDHAICFFFFFQAEDGIRDWSVTGVQTCALPISPGSSQVLLAKFNQTGGQRSGEFFVNVGGGILSFAWSNTGTGITSQMNSTASTGFADSSAHWVRFAFDVNDGAGNRVRKFYTSEDYDPSTGLGTWTQLGTTVTAAGTTSMFDSTARVTIGAEDGGTPGALAGKVYYADVRNGIDGTVATSFNPGTDAASPGATSFASSATSAHETWTLSGAAGLSTGNARDQISTYTYTVLNQLTTETNALGTRTQYFYDTAGNLIQT